jgi:5'(3')-deoxyribonucleotidase
VDLDDTLVNMMEKAVYYYNNRTGKDLTLDQIKTWELEDRSIFEEIWRIPGFFADLPFMDELAQNVLGLLKADGFEIVIVSAVPTWESCRDKYAWCHTHLRIPGLIDSMDQVILTRGKHYIKGDIMVDDKPANLLAVDYPIVFDRPWNKDCTAPRVFHWGGVYQEALQIRRSVASQRGYF